MTDPSALVNTARAAAAALGRVRRSPGKGERWVEKVWLQAQQDRPKTYDRLHRRIGFARKLAELAHLDQKEQAAVTTGLFLHVLIADTPERDLERAPPAWTEYFLRNIDWLTPALDVCHAVESSALEEEDRLPVVVGRVSALFDQEILEDHRRPLEVMAELRADPPTAAVEEIASLLWTEAGQALCDRHFRRHPRTYKVDAAEIRKCLEQLRPASSHLMAEITAQPLRLSAGIAEASARPNRHKEAKPDRHQIDAPVRVSDAFQRRRQLLRGASPIEGVPEEAQAHRARRHEEEPEVQHDLPTPDTTADDELTAKVNAIIERARDHVDDAPPPARHEGAGQDTPRRRPRTYIDEEADMDNIRSITAARAERGADLDLSEKLDELRTQLRQIQRLAVQAEELLASLAPQLDEFSTALVHLESMVQRLKGHDGAPQRDERAA
jgi:hypothetical protein